MRDIVRKSQPIFRDDTQATEHKMVTRALLCFALVSTGMIGSALGASADNASAADDCITESNLVPPKGSRWYYHMDRATNRKLVYSDADERARCAAHGAPVGACRNGPGGASRQARAQRIRAGGSISRVFTVEGATGCRGQSRRRAIARGDQAIALALAPNEIA
jgi:hypothetical protein